ncbi:hypothetical protein GQ43DRAFT_439437 [Delitschia confertaspora ATCC 74209]|uniref:25S rRNA (Uridine(2843)-N(3))-methyltransferase n=1 Tax=Delitschia confertaspora ATCC 74209 TaxID=1513339 RepID=A0A9P4JPF1_9PLEO|nr:hypothetical protein GQ43DRAFT_439437 [Delitschia confertaspora ATCC 74209]
MPPGSAQRRSAALDKVKKKALPTRAPKPRPAPKETPDSSSPIPQELHQLLLNIFKNSFTERLESDINPLLQEVKGHLYNRDFLTAFGRNDYLEAYAARWSPSRALGYLQVFSDLSEHIWTNSEVLPEEESSPHKIVCLGGGAGAEVVALGGYSNLLKRADKTPCKRKLDVVAVDIADWSSIVQRLHEGAVTEPPISKYATAAAKAANASLTDPESFTVSFNQSDVLNVPFPELAPVMEDASLITLLFTLNELYSSSISLTQKFLLNLTAFVKKGTLLLVVDSPGSYSSVSLNGTEKKYPMQWLLDHTLLRVGDKGEDPVWTKVLDCESKWFRLPPNLQYPIDLEHMRYQLHLYRKED